VPLTTKQALKILSELHHGGDAEVRNLARRKLKMAELNELKALGLVGVIHDGRSVVFHITGLGNRFLEDKSPGSSTTAIGSSPAITDGD
jgi:hypothetical protein